MKRVEPILAAALLVVAATAGHADENRPFVYLATDDPFAEGQASSPRNDVHVFGGVFSSDTFGGAVRFWETDHLDSYMAGIAYGRDVAELGAGFVLGGVVGTAIRFGESEDMSGEVWAGVRIRHYGLVVGDLAIAPGFTAGVSAVTGTTAVERGRETYYGGDARFLGYLGPELSFRMRQAPNVELVYQLHHRSGANGVFGDVGEGSNANTLGLRIRF